jgi:hypothetical protein
LARFLFPLGSGASSCELLLVVSLPNIQPAMLLDTARWHTLRFVSGFNGLVGSVF